MSEQALPTTYKGYATKDLLELFKRRQYPVPGEPESSMQAISIMWDFVTEYRLRASWVDYNASPEVRLAQQEENLARVKRQTAPFGVDLYPWADENGKRIPGWKPEYPEGYVNWETQEDPNWKGWKSWEEWENEDWDDDEEETDEETDQEETDQGKPTS